MVDLAKGRTITTLHRGTRNLNIKVIYVMPPDLKMGSSDIARRKEQHTFAKCAKEPVLECHDRKKK